jgi:hypothetical protein
MSSGSSRNISSGRLEHGFLRVRCESCHAEQLGSSITYRIAVGPHQGRKVFTLQTLPGCEEPFDHLGKLAVDPDLHRSLDFLRAKSRLGVATSNLRNRRN